MPLIVATTQNNSPLADYIGGGAPWPRVCIQPTIGYRQPQRFLLTVQIFTQRFKRTQNGVAGVWYSAPGYGVVPLGHGTEQDSQQHPACYAS